MKKNRMIIGLFVVAFIVAITQCIFDKAEINKRQEYNIDELIKSKVSFEYSTEGANITGFYSDDQKLQYLNVEILGELGKLIHEYTFANNYIVYTQYEIRYDEPFYLAEDKVNIQDITLSKYVIYNNNMYDITNGVTFHQVPQEQLQATQSEMQNFIKELQE